MKREIQIGPLVMGEHPYVVGSVSTWETLKALEATGNLPCDIVEVRLDLIGADTEGWLERCGELDASGIPVLLTIRHDAEGGGWSGKEEERTALLVDAMDSVSAIDLELQHGDFSEITDAASETGTAVIGSYHEFSCTPDLDELEELLVRGRRERVDIVKLATLVTSDEDQRQLLSLLSEPVQWLSVLAMGEGAVDRRVELVRAGSCLTYGFLDEAIAPGQVSAQALRDRLFNQR